MYISIVDKPLPGLDVIYFAPTNNYPKNFIMIPGFVLLLTFEGLAVAGIYYLYVGYPK